MYILASDFFEKDSKYYSKLEIRVVSRAFLAFKWGISTNICLKKYISIAQGKK